MRGELTYFSLDLGLQYLSLNLVTLLLVSTLTPLFVVLIVDLYNIPTKAILSASDYAPILVDPIYRLPDTIP